MTRLEMVAHLEEHVAIIKGFLAKVQAIPGASDDREIQGFVRKANNTIRAIFGDVNQFTRMTDDAYGTLNNYESNHRRFADGTLKSLEIAANSLVARGPQHTPKSVKIGF